MSIGNPRANATFLKAHGIAFRPGSQGDGTVVTGNGYIGCDSCGGYVVSKEEFANVVGVSPGVVSKWLRREPVRSDIAARMAGALRGVR